jgi:hypothetical protein
MHEAQFGGWINLYQLVLEMAHEEPYQPRWDAAEARRPRRPSSAGLKYRRPVWDAIAVEVDKANTGSPFASNKEKAGWLLEQLETCDRYRKYQTKLAEFMADISSLVRTDRDVVVTGEFQAKGEAAIQVVAKIVESLIPVLEKMTKKKKSR